MKVKQWKEVYQEFDLTEAAVNEVTVDRLYKLLDGGEYLRKEKGKTYLKQDDPNHRHGSISEEIVREATELDIAVLTVIRALRDKK